MQVFLIRHPPPAIEPGICYGRLDIDCHDVEPVANALRSQLPSKIPVYSSPAKRALKLALELSRSADVRVDHRLTEIDFGHWEGQRWDAIDRQAIDAWAADMLHFTPPGGESVATLQARAIDFATSLTGDAAIVTHGGIMRALVGHWKKLPFSAWTQLEFAFGELICLTLDQDARPA